MFVTVLDLYLFPKLTEMTEMTKNNKDRYQQIYKEVLKAYRQDKKLTVQRKTCDLSNIVGDKEKHDELSTISKDTLANL